MIEGSACSINKLSGKDVLYMKDYFGYKDKICIVTGAASGMGKSAAEMLVDLGAKVYALDWNEVKVEGIEKYIQVDLGEKDSIDRAFALIPGTIDSFFGIAGVSGVKTDFNKTVVIDFIANKLGLSNYFDAVSDGTNMSNSKPDPEVFIKASQYLKLKSQECLVVEDAKSGIDAAVNGGFDSAGLGEAAAYD